ncbi:hypothetical protein PUNSTDRAFT_134216 [Punctularia strigosozonata HHB-11173 SS5]|uniref:uncharacterized protein n=1 Tax=Punctularia strigosozonata (strain HHB-11173) TaxID=741275 RepID=UPI00044163C1|nr:uncharacterized protein PUNSTDRAFT_134216 [Punctularia strigosozonata HHB-11173 SS5]EIN09042.1 hypothetical protein PUNSTDRAFT_134216 [Punctularia strigosozonata HHB-11173 SS5]
MRQSPSSPSLIECFLRSLPETVSQLYMFDVVFEEENEESIEALARHVAAAPAPSLLTGLTALHVETSEIDVIGEILCASGGRGDGILSVEKLSLEYSSRNRHLVRVVCILSRPHPTLDPIALTRSLATTANESLSSLVLKVDSGLSSGDCSELMRERVEAIAAELAVPQFGRLVQRSVIRRGQIYGRRQSAFLRRVGRAGREISQVPLFAGRSGLGLCVVENRTTEESTLFDHFDGWEEVATP